MAKLNIDFVLLDESKLRHGFRALMSGAELDDFKENPVMLLQHNRPREYEGRPNIMFPIGKWYDIRVEGARLLGKPEFDDDDEIAVKVQKKVEKGYLNGASVWIDPIESTEDPRLMLPGQSMPTLSRWGVNEASIVDIPGCRSALALRNSAGERIELSASSTIDVANTLKSFLKTFPIKTNMKKEHLLKLGLSEGASDDAIADKLTALLNVNEQLQNVASENTNLKNEVIALKAAANTARIDALIDDAKKSGKIFEGEVENYKKLAAADFDTTKSLLDAMKPAKSLQVQFEEGAQSDSNKLAAAELVKLSGAELYRLGKLEQLKDLDLPSFKLKYKEAFGVDYNN